MADGDEVFDLLHGHGQIGGARVPRLFTSSARWTRDPGAVHGLPRKVPDLDDASTAIVAANVNALAAIYVAATLEELKLFAVADRVVQAFLDGALPIQRPEADRLTQYLHDAPTRLTGAERADVYARALGLGAPSSPPPPPNAELASLWNRFLTVVQTREGGGDGGAAARSAARALARNLSRHGGGLMHAAAMELQRLTRDVLSMLSAPGLLAAYGVQDRWQLVERVSALSLGGGPSSAALRTRAQRGATIIQWLADHAAALAGEPSTLDPRADEPLRAAVESWLSAAATP